MIKNIIFDLGGVIVDMDTRQALAAFNKLDAKIKGTPIDINTHPKDIDLTLYEQFEKEM